MNEEYIDNVKHLIEQKDADPQANASSGLGVDIKKSECPIYECIIDRANVQDLSLIHI